MPESPLLHAYHDLIRQGHIAGDPAQEALLKKLQSFARKLKNYTPVHERNLLSKRLARQSLKEMRQGLYIWGEVGRGKSMLMDLFFDHAPLERKQRIHFHAFMQDVHKKLFALRQKETQKDPLVTIARSISRQHWLLCFDEFQVTDIADAMILGRLFTALFEEGVMVVATSNRPPHDLYKDGLQRANFEPFIALLQQRLEVLELAATRDYRLGRLQAMEQRYRVITGKEAENFAGETFALLSNHHHPEPRTLTVNNRALTLSKTYGTVAWCSFGELCEQPLGPGDYLAIAEHLHVLILTGIPQLTPEKRNEAKRFVTLIDALYEQKVKLICTAEAEPENLYPKGTGAFEFQRTVSRLREMQAADY